MLPVSQLSIGLDDDIVLHQILLIFLNRRSTLDASAFVNVLLALAAWGSGLGL